MKRWFQPLALAALLILAVGFGLMLGQGGGLAGLWQDWQRWLGHDHATLNPADPALKAGLPKPDPAAGLPDSPLNELLQPDLTPQQQTQIVGQMLIDYWTSVHSLPNGTWDEIRDQLAGRNRPQLALVPRDHPALATDTFRSQPDGSGIHLHVISSSGCAFQLIHDGPDHQPYTDDDLIRNFPPDLEFQ